MQPVWETWVLVKVALTSTAASSKARFKLAPSPRLIFGVPLALLISSDSVANLSLLLLPRCFAIWPDLR